MNQGWMGNQGWVHQDWMVSLGWVRPGWALLGLVLALRGLAQVLAQDHLGLALVLVDWGPLLVLGQQEQLAVQHKETLPFEASFVNHQRRQPGLEVDREIRFLVC